MDCDLRPLRSGSWHGSERKDTPTVLRPPRNWMARDQGSSFASIPDCCSYFWSSHAVHDLKASLELGSK